VPYAYRHSYAQRHADAGVQPDVLRELMSHRSMRTTTGYLPELKSYLQQLLADRERLHASTDMTPWARAQATPPDEQVSQVRELIRRIEADLDSLNDTDRAQIQQAVTAIRAARQTVSLGMPATRPAAGDR
jgi:DNA-binding MurR/RpiR family transcriptional regulator